MKCLQCDKEHTRKKFCSNHCKDLYHNIHNPRGKFAHLNLKNNDAVLDDDVHPFSSDALGQY